MKKTKTTKKHFKLFKKEAKKWIGIFNLNDWDFIYKHKDVKDGVAESGWDLTGKTATLTLTTIWDSPREFNNQEIKVTALHEVLHILIGRLASLGKWRYVKPNEIEEAQEEIVNRLIEFIRKNTSLINNKRE